MHLVDKDFTGVINAGSPTPCSKYDFGIHLAEEFGFDHVLINKGAISDHNFVAPRHNKLDLNISKLSYMGLTAPDYRESLKRFSQNIINKTNIYFLSKRRFDIKKKELLIKNIKVIISILVVGVSGYFLTS